MKNIEEIRIACIEISDTLHYHAKNNSQSDISVYEGDIYSLLADKLNIGFTNSESSDESLKAIEIIPHLLCDLEKERLSNSNYTKQLFLDDLFDLIESNLNHSE